MRSSRPFVADALAAGGVGAWDYDVAQDRLRGDRVMAAMFGLSDQESDEGVSIRRIVATIHPADRAFVQAKRADARESGGMIVVQFRAAPPPKPLRWILARGRYESDADARVTHGCGIVVDVTGSRHPSDSASWTAEVSRSGDDQAEATLDRAAEHTLAARRAIDDLGIRALSLRPAVDALLLELGRRLAAAGAARMGNLE